MCARVAIDASMGRSYLFCRNLELAYAAMVERSRTGPPRAEIDVRRPAGSTGAPVKSEN
jgi:hypothetical protein